jgi:hypothetical protein
MEKMSLIDALSPNEIESIGSTFIPSKKRLITSGITRRYVATARRLREAPRPRIPALISAICDNWRAEVLPTFRAM